jgi:hypothetical protein
MAPPSYLGQIAARRTTEPGRTTIAPQRVLFQPIPVHAALPLEAETEIALLGPSGMLQSAIPRPTVPAGKPASTALPAGPMRPHAAARDPAPAPSSIRDAEETGPKPLPQTTGSGQFAERAVPVHNADRDPRPALALEQLAAQTPHSLMPPGDRRRLRDPEVPSAAAESIAARDERIQLMPPLNRGPRVIGGATATRAARETTEGRVHIGSLEVHVAAPPVAAAPPTRAPLPGARNGRAIAPLARGFPGFGLVQS